MKPVRWVTWNRESDLISSPVLRLCQRAFSLRVFRRIPRTLRRLHLSSHISPRSARGDARSRGCVARAAGLASC